MHLYLGLLVLALLVGNAAAGLAGRLAGSLALAATAVILAQSLGLQGLDLHGISLHFLIFYILTHETQIVNGSD